MNCPICNIEVKNIRSLMRHIKLHNYDSKKLYDEFIKKETEGICIVCKKETKYKNYSNGYNKFCSNKCACKYNVSEYWNSNNEKVLERKLKHREEFKKYQNLNGRPKGTKNKNPYPKTKAVLGKYIKNPPPSWYGKKHTEKTKDKMSLTRSIMIENGEVKMGSYKGLFKPKNPQKYLGNVNNIVWRSTWEKKFLTYCDLNENVLEYSSEEISIPYLDPTTNRIRRYFPDVYMKVKDKDGQIKKYLIEIKPKRQTLPPPTSQRKTKKYLNEVYTYAKNESKWKAAKEFCLDNGWEFKIITEYELGLK